MTPSINTLIITLTMIFLASCSKPKVELRTSGTLTESTAFKIKNLTVIRIDPNGQKVSVDWKGYNLRTGSALNIPFEEITVTSGTESYFISDKKVGNNKLKINEKIYSFDSNSQQILIEFGVGVSIESGLGYQSAHDPYHFVF